MQAEEAEDELDLVFHRKEAADDVEHAHSSS
jgi:hypothetical protein